MKRLIVSLWLGGLAPLISSCGNGPQELTSGIEGSGISNGVAITSAGSVTELGSIFVNGVRYDLAGARITLDGQLTDESALKVGSVVVVEGTINPDGVTGRATRVTAGTAVAGPIDSIDITHDGFTVFGQTVLVNAGTVIENRIEGQPLGGLTLGSDVAVTGFADSSGAIWARRIALRPDDAPMVITGSVSAVDPTNLRFTINGASVDYANATLTNTNPGLAAGDPVRVTASVVDDDGTIRADEVAYRDSRLPGAEGDRAALQGWVTRYVSASDFDVDGRRVVSTNGALNVALDEFVTINGEITADGAVDYEILLAGGPPKVWVRNANGVAIEGAVVTIRAGNNLYQATTDMNGIAVFPTFPGGGGVFSVSAAGYETETFDGGLGYGEYYGLSLRAEGEWALGRPVVLATRFKERAGNGSSLTFEVDLAMLDQSGEAIETLTSSDFSIGSFDCGWGGGRDCASDANGNETGSFWMGGNADSFAGLQQASPRSPYVTEIVAVLSDREDWRTSLPYWSSLAPALKSFVAQVGGNDSISLSSVQIVNGVTTQTVYGPFTSDGSVFFGDIDELGQPVGHDWPPIVQGVSAAIQRVADARDAAGSDVEASVLVLGQPWMSVEEVNIVTALARQMDVHVSTVEYWTSFTYGMSEVAMRTGGLVGFAPDSRQFPQVFSAMDRLIAGTMPFYRMEFTLTGDAGTFVSGGNAKVRIHVAVPTSLPYFPIEAIADVEIP